MAETMEEYIDSDHKDANEHIKKVLKIVDLFHIPNITQDQIMLRAFPMSLTRAASHWLRNKPSGLIKTWEDLKAKFLSNNFGLGLMLSGDLLGDTVGVEAVGWCWFGLSGIILSRVGGSAGVSDLVGLMVGGVERSWGGGVGVVGCGSVDGCYELGGLLGRCKVLGCGDGWFTLAAVCRWVVVGLYGFAGGVRRVKSRNEYLILSNETSNGLAAIQAQLNNLGREIKKVNEKVYAAQVGCKLCKGPHYSKDCPLKEEGKTLEEAYYTQFGIPFQQGGKYRAAALGFYQRNNANPSYQERRKLMEESQSKFINESAKRPEENSNLIKEFELPQTQLSETKEL
ncbi:hypothetical protein Tco_0848860 [Tanacetum coccineum]